MSGRRISFEAVDGHPEFVPLASLSGVRVDLRYAGLGNVFGQAVYAGLDCAWVHVDAGAALGQTVAWLAEHAPDQHLLVLDALRPHRIQQTLWDSLADTSLRLYLADPSRGSIHSYGLAVDATLIDDQGHELDMGTPFDAMTPLSHPELEAVHLTAGALRSEQVANRELLRSAMRAGGFQGIRHEWWHFDLHDREEVRAHGLRVE